MQKEAPFLISDAVTPYLIKLNTMPQLSCTNVYDYLRRVYDDHRNTGRTNAMQDLVDISTAWENGDRTSALEYLLHEVERTPLIQTYFINRQIGMRLCDVLVLTEPLLPSDGKKQYKRLMREFTGENRGEDFTEHVMKAALRYNAMENGLIVAKSPAKPEILKDTLKDKYRRLSTMLLIPGNMQNQIVLSNQDKEEVPENQIEYLLYVQLAILRYQLGQLEQKNIKTDEELMANRHLFDTADDVETAIIWWGEMHDRTQALKVFLSLVAIYSFDPEATKLVEFWEKCADSLVIHPLLPKQTLDQYGQKIALSEKDLDYLRKHMLINSARSRMRFEVEETALIALRYNQALNANSGANNEQVVNGLFVDYKTHVRSLKHAP